MGQQREPERRPPDEAIEEAAGRTAEDQGTEGGLTEATHGRGRRNPERREGPGAEPDRAGPGPGAARTGS